MNTQRASHDHIITESTSAKYVLLLAHGAGAPMTHSFMEQLAGELSQQNAHVVRFNFPYINQGRKMPGSPKPNIAAIGEMIDFCKEHLELLPLFISGKSYGGRMCSHWLQLHTEGPIGGIVYFGFPLHAPGKVGKSRADHLYEISHPQLFIQGTRDALANYVLMNEVVDNCQQASIHTIDHGDHSFKVSKKLTEKSQSEIIHEIATVTNQWVIDQI
ncbi:MAG: alpha/beta fold hydrolase [Cyclobacteriaceae bacterium]